MLKELEELSSWARSLKARVAYPMGKLLIFNQVVRERPEEFKEVEKLYMQQVTEFEEYELKKYHFKANCHLHILTISTLEALMSK